MAGMITVSPKYGHINQERHLLGLACNFDASACDPFNPLREDAKWTDGGSAGTFLPYAVNGMAWDFTVTAGNYVLADKSFGVPLAQASLRQDLSIAKTFALSMHRSGQMKAANDIKVYQDIRFSSISTSNYLNVRLMHGTAASSDPGLTLTVHGRVGAFTFSLPYVLPAGHWLYDINTGWQSNFNLCVCWSKEAYDAGADAIAVFANGRYIVSYSSSDGVLDVGQITDASVHLTNVIKVGVGTPGYAHRTSWREFGIWPGLRAGDGTAEYPYELMPELSAYADGAKNIKLDLLWDRNCVWVPGEGRVASSQMNILLPSTTRSGTYPRSVVVPITDTAYAVEYELKRINYRHNNPFVKKAPILMVDDTLQELRSQASSQDFWLNTEYRLTSPEPSWDGHARFGPRLQLIPRTDYNDFRNGVEDNYNFNSETVVTVAPVRHAGASSYGLLNEESYRGFVAINSELGSSTEPLSNGGWPVQCDRSPSSPLILYRDSTSSPVVPCDDQTLRQMRFVGLARDSGAPRATALVAAMMITGDVTGAVSVWDAELVLGRMFNNDRMEISPSFGTTGFKTLANIDCAVMLDLPNMAGNTAPIQYTYPDLAIVPIGDPDTTTSHRVYYMKKTESAPTGYNYKISYIDLSDNGETAAAAADITIHERPLLTGSLSVTVDSVFQFDIIQPTAGRFLLAATMGQTGLVPGADDIDEEAITVIYHSDDGINFYSPVVFKSSGLSKNESSGVLPLCAHPYLSYTAKGRHRGEVFLSLTSMYGPTVDAEYYQTTIYTANTDTLFGNSSANARGWAEYCDCTQLVSEYDSSNKDNVFVIGASVFRDRHDKVHIAINKVAQGTFYAAHGSGLSDDWYGGIYYAVLDDSNLSQTGYRYSNRESSSGNPDIVSFSRFARSNRPLDVPSATGVYTAMCYQHRPYFSPVGDDAFFTFSTFVNPANYAAVSMDEFGPDLIWRLFKPTDLGELYPPSFLWHGGQGLPAVDAFNDGHYQLVYGISNTGVAPTVSGAQITNLAPLAARYVYKDDDTSVAAMAPLPQNSLAIKTGFALSSDTGAPIDIVNRGSYAIKIETFTMGTEPDVSVATTYRYIADTYIVFNQDTVEILDSIGTVLWSSSTTDLTLDFSTFFNEVFVVVLYDKETESTNWNIYVSRTPGHTNEFEQPGWAPKSWILLNDEPINIATLSSVGAISGSNTIVFGGHQSGVGTWGADDLVLRYFQVYTELFKSPRMSDDREWPRILWTGYDKTIPSPATTGAPMRVSGATLNLGTRTRTFRGLSAISGAGTFQLRRHFDDINVAGAPQSADRRVDLGNNTELSVPEFGFNEGLDFSTVYRHNLDNAIDGFPASLWKCAYTTAPCRVYLDANAKQSTWATLGSPDEIKLRANSVWFKNTNLVNARVKGSDSSGFGTGVDYYIDFRIDHGTVTTVYGVAGTDAVLVIEDTTKNWTVNEFVNNDSPYHIIKRDAASTNTGGRIVANTETKIFYTLSVESDGTTAYTELGGGDDFAIVAPSKFVEFDDTHEYRYWAIELLPNAAGDYSWWCDGVAQIGDFGLGVMIDLDKYGDVGFVESWISGADIARKNSGDSQILPSLEPMHREYSISFTNVEELVKNKLHGMFLSHKLKNRPIWFLKSNVNDNDLMLCEWSDASFAYDVAIDNYLELDPSHNFDSAEQPEGVFSCELKLLERA